jgi:transposase
MADLFWLKKAQIGRISPAFPFLNGARRVDDQRVVIGITHVARSARHWRDVPAEYGHRQRKTASLERFPA